MLIGVGTSGEMAALERLFVPLGMTQSIFRDGPVVVRPDQALGYHGDEAGFHLAQATGADTSRIVGNSGLTTEPHLHVHAERDNVAAPITFDGRWLVRNAIVRR